MSLRIAKHELARSGADSVGHIFEQLRVLIEAREGRKSPDIA
jgi:hypothetical protein